MFRTSRLLSFSALLLSAGACSNFLNGDTTPAVNSAVTAAFNTVPLGFANNSSSFGGDADGIPSMWLPGTHAAGFGHDDLMGGGLGDAFAGGIGMGHHHGNDGPFGGRFGGGFICTGSFNGASGRYVCDPVTHDGLTITQSSAYKNAAGAVQQSFDSLATNEVNVQTLVSGTVTFSRDSSSGEGEHGEHGGHGGPRHNGHITGDTTTILSATTTVNHSSDRTVSGLAAGSTQRTINGASSGQESSTGTSSQGVFTATRTAADTTKGVIIPVSDSTRSYPTAGSVTRVMTATVTYAGQAAASVSRREVVTYDGSAIAKVVITTNGTTQNCTRRLPHGHLSCS
ncbi:MAG: hypothetical protein ABIT38_04210 [Gemmatimonadaceae bacterium]